MIQEKDLRLLTCDEVAAMLRLSRAGVYAMARRGDLPAVRIGASVRFRPAAVAGWLDSHETAADRP